MKKETAKQVVSILLESSSKLEESLRLVASEGNADDTAYYRKIVAIIMGEMFVELMRPIFKEHPDLKPPGLK